MGNKDLPRETKRAGRKDPCPSVQGSIHLSRQLCPCHAQLCGDEHTSMHAPPPVPDLQGLPKAPVTMGRSQGLGHGCQGCCAQALTQPWPMSAWLTWQFQPSWGLRSGASLRGRETRLGWGTEQLQEEEAGLWAGCCWTGISPHGGRGGDGWDDQGQPMGPRGGQGVPSVCSGAARGLMERGTARGLGNGQQGEETPAGFDASRGDLGLGMCLMGPQRASSEQEGANTWLL